MKVELIKGRSFFMAISYNIRCLKSRYPQRHAER